MSSEPNRRFLVVPEAGAEAAVVVSATTTADGARNEAGLQIGQPEKVANDAPFGDIALTLSGTPETHVEGVAVLTREGVVEDARYGWVRDGDDTATDLQFRQSPHVVCRRPDNLAGGIYDGGSDTSRQIRPRLLVLASGDVLMVWMRRIWMPIWARDATALGGGPTDTIYYSVLDHDTDTWSDPVLGPYPVSVTGAGPCISAVDIAQFPDTGEIVMCVATSESMTPGSAEPRIMFVYVSQDDGDTWTLKHRLHFDGNIPDIILTTDGGLTVDDDTPFQDWALERLESDRLCLVGATESNTWSLVSDDRGASWSVTHLQTHSSMSSDFDYAGHGCGAGMARNGIACYVTALRNSGAVGLSSIGLWMTRDGVTFSSRVEIPYTTDIFQSVDVTACMSPDGWIHVYGTEHASKRAILESLNPQDWLWGRRFKTRDPDIADTITSLTPAGGGSVSGPATAFHLGTGSPEGSYAVPETSPDPCVYDGFVGLDAVLYRGQILMAVVRQRDGTQPESDSQPKLEADALMVYRLNAWQPIQERVNNALQSPSGIETIVPAWPAIGRIYNQTWDCYDKPENVGWAKAGAGTVTMVRAGADGGYLSVVGAPCYWTQDVTGNLDIGLAANLRIVMRCVLGGSTSSDAIACRIALRDGVGRTDLSIRFERSGANVKVALYDNVNAAQIGITITLVAADWTEVLFAQHRIAGSTANARAYLFARRYDRANDPDWDAPYDAGAAGVSFLLGAVGGTNYIRWGHLESGEPETLWKGVHLSRSWAKTGDVQADEPCAVVQAGTTYIDDDATSDRSTSGTGEPPLDNGIDNWMRTSRILAEPRNFISRGVHASFRGEAVTRGTWAYATSYAFAAANILRQPVLQEWRGETDNAEAAIVLDAGERGFRPDAVAVFGHNLAGMTFEFNDTDSWSSPTVAFAFGVPGGTVVATRYTHEWYTTTNFSGEGYRITRTSGEPWRPHQFKSDPGGQQHYFCYTASSINNVWRIRDNDENTLFMESNVSDAGFSLKSRGAIFSDRFACMVGHHFDAVDTNKTVVYRYCRIVLWRTRHWDADAAFPRIGRIVLGQTIEISAPDMEWGWRTGYASGATLTQQPTGAAYSRRLRPTQRTWSVDRPLMLPPPESSAVVASPSSQPATQSWASWSDTIRRIEGDGVACALIWDSPWFAGFADEERVQCAVDPLGVVMCHVTALGTLEHAAYVPETLNLAGGATCVPRPVASVRGIDMTETF